MPKIKGKYETIFIVNSSLDEEAITAVVDKFKTLIGENAEIEKVEEWGKRRFAYLINDMTEGYYVFISFESVPSFPAELDRIYKITDAIMRSLIIAKDA